MRAMVLRGCAPIADAPLAAEDWPVPEPGPGEVRIAVSTCAVCRTDLHVVEGDLPDVPDPIVPGHQVVGVVDALGPGVGDDGPRLGERVGLAWVSGTCGRCRACRSGRENLCAAARLTGYRVHGGYAERVVAPAAWVHRLPDALDDEHAAPLLCAGIIGFRALERSRVRPGERLGLVGFGGSAHVAIQIARERGCEVHVASRGAGHLELARELGAAWTGGVEDLAPDSLDAVVLFAPAGGLVPPLLRALRPGGTLACAGIHMSRIPPLDYDRELFGERTLTSVTANTRADARAFLAEAAAARVATRTRRYALEEANRALADLERGRLQGSAVLVVGGGVSRAASAPTGA